MVQLWDNLCDLILSFQISAWWANLLIGAGIFLAFLLLRGIFAGIIFKLIFKLSTKTRTDLDSAILSAFEGPLKALFLVIGAYLSLSYLINDPGYQLCLVRFLRAFLVALVGWGFYNLSGTYTLLFKNISEKLNLEADHILILLFSKVIRFVIIALIISIIVREWGFDVNGFIAGLGLGGLAVALAAKDALANIFGGVVIIIDKPFSVGDWIYSPSIEGTVEDMSFRSTRVRTFANALVTVPNSVLANEPVTNWTRMGKRRITFHLGVTYSTPSEKLQNCVTRIREMLETHPGVHQETIFVRFDKFGDSSLDIFIYLFTKTTLWGEYLEVKEDINFKIMGILEDEGVSVAFPSRSLYLETPVRTVEAVDGQQE